MAENAQDIAEHLATIRNNINSLTQAVSQLASETGNIQKSIVQNLGHATRNAIEAGDWVLEEAGRLGGEAMHAAERGANAAVTEVQDHIERNPFTAVLIAMGFGVVVGLLGGARSRSPRSKAAPRRR